MLTSLVQINPSFVSVQAAKVWLDQCMQIDEIKRVKIQAQALEREMQEAGAIKIYAERRLGQILGEVEIKRGVKPQLVNNFDQFGLRDIGISKNESMWYQTLASIPDEVLDDTLADYEARGRIPKASGIARNWRAEQKAQELKETPLYMTVNKDGGMMTNSMAALVESVASGNLAPFGCVYADPPWRYDNNATRAAAKNHYPTMTVDEIKAMPIEKLVGDRALLWLWTTNAFLRESFEVIEAWGFDYKSVLVWDKAKMGIGNYVRLQHEFLMIGSRGKQTTLTTNTPSVIRIQRERHSAKPEAIREVVERNSPASKLELFGRARKAGWVVYGNEDYGEQIEWRIGKTPIDLQGKS